MLLATLVGVPLSAADEYHCAHGGGSCSHPGRSFCATMASYTSMGGGVRHVYLPETACAAMGAEARVLEAKLCCANTAVHCRTGKQGDASLVAYDGSTSELTRAGEDGAGAAALLQQAYDMVCGMSMARSNGDCDAATCARSVRAAATSFVADIDDAIAVGVLLYNAGDIEGCAKVYTEAVSSMVADTNLPHDVRPLLYEGLAIDGSADDRAWALRRAMDAAKTALEERASAWPSVRAAGADLDLLSGPMWVSVDGVMGGKSSGTVKEKKGIVTFKGTVNTNGGGFAYMQVNGLPDKYMYI